MLEKLTEIGERTARIEALQEGMKSQIDELKSSANGQDTRLGKYNQLLDEHIQGVKTANARLDEEIKNRQDLENRVNKLEEDPKFKKTLKSKVIKAGYIAAAILSIAELLKKFKL